LLLDPGLAGAVEPDSEDDAVTSAGATRWHLAHEVASILFPPDAQKLTTST
jgi:hypothetical protein